MSGPKISSFLENVMAEAASLAEENKITLSTAAQDTIDNMENKSKRSKHPRPITYISNAKFGESTSGKTKDQNDAEHLEYLHDCMNDLRTEKESMEEKLDIAKDDLQATVSQRKQTLSN